MPTNPETSSNTPETQESTETQETIDITKAQTDALKEEITTTGGTKDELKNTFANFFSKLGEAWNTFIKEGNFSKAIAVLFGSAKQESQQSTSTNTTKNTGNSTENYGTESTSTTDSQKESKEKEPKDSDKVSIEKYIPGIKYDLKYATTDNSFGGKVMYKKDASEYLKLEYDAVKKLSKAQEILKKQGYQIKIRDALRPHDAQVMLRNNYKGPTSTKRSNVAIPEGITYQGRKGTGSHHGTGKAIDLTLVDSNGNELEMPTKFDDFSGKAKWINIKGKNGQKYKNAYILRRAMEQAGFYTIGSEWRHYQTNSKNAESHLPDSEYKKMGINF